MIKVFCLGAIAVAGILAVAKPAIAEGDCGSSFVYLPNGRCVNLTYTTFLGASRDAKNAANAQYEKILDANVTLDTSSSYRRTESEDERKERMEILAKTRQVKQATATDNQKVEDILYPIHRRAMSAVEGTLAPKW